MTTNCNIKKHKVIKLVLITTILTLLSYAFLSTMNEKIYATQTRENYSEEKKPDSKVYLLYDSTYLKL